MDLATPNWRLPIARGAREARPLPSLPRPLLRPPDRVATTDRTPADATMSCWNLQAALSEFRVRSLDLAAQRIEPAIASIAAAALAVACLSTRLQPVDRLTPTC